MSAQPASAGVYRIDNTLDQDQLAELLRVSPATLADWRVHRRGPAYVRAGRSVL